MSRSKCARRRKRYASMMVTLPGSVASPDARGQFKRGRGQVDVSVVLDRGEIVVFILDKKTGRPTSRLNLGGSEAFVAAVHALETASW